MTSKTVAETGTKSATVKEIKEFFGFTSVAQMNAEWKQLTDKDKEQIREGIGNGTFTY